MIKPPVTSRRIDRLRREVEAGTSGAESTFWQQVEREGTPLVEELKDGQHVLITFVWRGGPQTAAVTGVVFRAIGPSLSQFGVPGPIQDPIIEIHDRDGAIIGLNG